MKEHISYIREKLSNIPNFIDTTSQTHYLIWLAMLDINDEIIKIISPNILSERVINKINIRIVSILDNISEIAPGHIELKIMAHYSNFFLRLENYLLENELYESCRNLQIFNICYYKKNPIK